MVGVADWLTHVLLAYVAATALSWRSDDVTPPLVSAAMVGALLPDLSKVALVFPASAIEDGLGIPFDWLALHRLGGVIVVVALAITVVPRDRRGPVLGFLTLGVTTHVLADSLLYKPEGLAFEFLWPLTTYRVPVDGFYVSSDRWPAAFALALAAVAWTVTRVLSRRGRRDAAGETAGRDAPTGD